MAEQLFTETTTHIEQIGQNLKGDFAVRTPHHPQGGWIRPTNLAGFAMAVAAEVTGKQLRITYRRYSAEPGAQRFYDEVSKIEIV